MNCIAIECISSNCLIFNAFEFNMKTSISQVPVMGSNDVCPFCHYPLSLIGRAAAAAAARRGARPRNSAAAAALNPDPRFHHRQKQTCHYFHPRLFRSAPNIPW